MGEAPFHGGQEDLLSRDGLWVLHLPGVELLVEITPLVSSDGVKVHISSNIFWQKLNFGLCEQLDLIYGLQQKLVKMNL